MNVSMASYQAVSILHGGPNTQLRMTARHLSSSGVTASLFDPWRRFGRGDADLFHIFAANIGTYHLAREIHALGIPLVVSPIIYSLHSNAFVRRSLVVTRFLQRIGKGIWSDYALTSDTCRWASAILPNSQDEANLLVEGLGVEKSKVHVIPNGVEDRFAHADPGTFVKKYGVKDFILNVGHIGHERKNVLSLIKALGGIDHPSVIIGRIIRSSYGDACVREAARYKQILLIDGLDHESDLLASAYAASDVFVLPSLFETPGIAALEAALSGAKIVITEKGGAREYFGTMAGYVDSQSVESIREGIVRSLGAAKDDRLKEHVRREFLWPIVAGKTATVYRHVLDGRGHDGGLDRGTVFPVPLL